ncbi:MAG: hypothetical protein ACKVOM_05190 [Ferruginibacter sp.]
MKILSILPFLLFTMILANAQEVVSYRGAFAPAPTRQWTEGWAEFNPNAVVYPATTVTQNTDITTNTTWTANNTYLLSGVITVSSGATLTIEPGTVIRGTVGTNSSLLIARGGKLLAEGTQCRPIVFTSNRPENTRQRGDWGGVLILGNARNNLGTSNQIEGLTVGDPRYLHGGNDDADNSGVLKYVRIEYAGFIFSNNNEINSLTMGSVGNGTVIDYVQTSYGLDDSFEWFGGSVNASHLIAYRGLDDDLDTDNGYSGTVQFALCIKDANASDQSQSEGFESDNSSTGIDGLLPKTSARFLNVTQIGAFRCGSNAGPGIAPLGTGTGLLHRRGARVRRNSDLRIQNSILMNNWRGLFVDDAVVGSNPTASTSNNYNEDSAVYRNNIIAGDFTTSWGSTGSPFSGTQSLAYENGPTRTIGTNAIYANDSLNTCDLLVDPWNANENLADFRPNAGVGAVVTNPALVSAGANLSISLTVSALFSANQARPLVVVLGEIGGGSTNGTVTVNIAKPSGWAVTFNPTATLSGSTVLVNSNWNFVDEGASIVITSKPGTIIGRNGVNRLGLTITRNAGTAAGTNQSVSANVVGGGDVTPGNNSTLRGLSAIL